MALDLAVTYPGQVDEGDPGFPQGKARNVVVEGDGTGFPLEKTWVNDLLGFEQALLDEASITPSGDPDEVGASQYLEAVQAIALAANGVFSPMHPAFGAVGHIVTESEDDTAALQACFDAAKAFIASTSGGGNVTVDLGGRQYRITGMIEDISPHVNVRNGKFVMYDATASALEFSVSASLRTFGVWDAFDLAYAEANSGTMILNASAAVKVKFRNCRFNASGFCTGEIFDSSGASEFIFEDCVARSATTGTAMASNVGTLRLLGGEYTMAPAAISNFCYGDTFFADRVKFVHVSTVGDIAFIAQTGSGEFDSHVTDCVFDVDDSGAGASTYAIALAADRFLQSSGNKLRNNAALYKAAAGPLGAGSDVQLLPHISYLINDPTTTLPLGYRTYLIRSDDSAPPVVTMRDPIVKGQRAKVGVRNISGLAWTGVIGFVAETVDVAYTEAGGLTDLADDEIATIEFVAVDLDTGLAWVQVGDAAQHFLAS
jgi:hypothetical protein